MFIKIVLLECGWSVEQHHFYGLSHLNFLDIKWERQG